MTPDKPELPDLDAALPPLLRKKSLPMLLGVLALIWVSAAMIGHWSALVLAGLLTVGGAFGLWWLWRKLDSQRELMALLLQAQGSPDQRQAVLEQLALRSGKGDDAVLGQLARAQILAQSDPDAAIEALSSVDVSKIPGEAADQVRMLHCQLLLFRNRTKEARVLADVIAIPVTAEPAQRTMAAAVIAEAWARTGKAKEADELLATYSVDEPTLGDARTLLRFARIFAFFGAGKPDRARKDMKALFEVDPQLLARFLQPGPGIHLDLRKLAGEVMRAHPTMRGVGQPVQRFSQKRMR